MGNQQSGSGGGLSLGDGNADGGSRIKRGLVRQLSRISEASLEWSKGNADDDSIWDEASLAEDVHSLGRSSHSDGDEPDAIELLPSVIKITQEIDKAKYRLLKAQYKTIEKRRDQRVELNNYRSELKKKEKLLLKVSKRATSYFSYFDYFNMVKRAYDVKKNDNLNTTKRNTANCTSSQTKKRFMSTALVTQANSFYFSIFALWEAYLLKKTHVALMQDHQQKIHKRIWNSMILHVKLEKEGVEDAFEDQELEIKVKIADLMDELTPLQNASTNYVRCQEKIIQKLQEHENSMSGSALDVNSIDERESPKSDEESDHSASIPLEINTNNNHDAMSVSVMGLSIDSSVSHIDDFSERKDIIIEKHVVPQDTRTEQDVLGGKVDASIAGEATPTENTSEEENQERDKDKSEIGESSATEDCMPITGASDADHQSSLTGDEAPEVVDEEVDLNLVEDKVIEEDTPTESTSEEENQEMAIISNEQ